MQVLKTETLNTLYDNTETRIKDIHSFRQLLISIKSFDDFCQYKVKFTQFFFDIEDELRENLQSSKSAYIQMIEMRDQLELLVQRYEILENKCKNSDNYNKELKQNVKDCLEQMKFQDNLRSNSEKYIAELEKKIKNLDNEIKNLKQENFEIRDLKRDVSNIILTSENSNKNIILTNTNISNGNKIDLNFQRNNSDSYNNNCDNQQIFRKIDSSNIFNNFNNINPNNSNKFTNLNYKDSSNFNTLNIPSYLNLSKKPEISDESEDSSSLLKLKEKLSNFQLNEIISDRESSKKIINEYIKNNLNFNYNTDQLCVSSNNTLNLNEEKKITFGKEEEENKNGNLYENNKEREIFKEIRSDVGSLNNSGKKLINERNYIQDEGHLFKNKITHINNQIINNQNYLIDNRVKENIEFKNNEEKEKRNYREKENRRFETKNKKNDEHKNEIENLNRNVEKNQINMNNKINTASNFYSHTNDPTKILDLNIVRKSNEEKKSEENTKNPPYSISKNQNKRADKILDIVLKIRTVEDISAIVFHLFGEDILDRIISADADEELIEKVEATIQEVERLINKEYTETEPLQDPPKRIVHTSIIEEKEEESTFNNTMNNKENINNIKSNNFNNNNQNFSKDYKEVNLRSSLKNNYENNFTNEINNTAENPHSQYLAFEYKNDGNYINKQDDMGNIQKYTDENDLGKFGVNSNNFNIKQNINSISQDNSKHSYDIITENNLRRSGSKFKSSANQSNNRSLSKNKRDKVPNDSCAASRINFEKSLRNYEESREFCGNYGRLNTSGNMNKKIFNNYMKNRGDVFDTRIHRHYDANYEKRKSNSNNKNRIKNDFPKFNLDVKSIKEMQRFKELYEKFKHLAGYKEDSNENKEGKISVGYNKRNSAEFKNINDIDSNYTKNGFQFNDDI